MTQEEDRIRTIAGYLLKNNSRLILGSPPEVVQYVKAAVLQAFNDPSIIVRNAASQDIVAFLGVLEPKNWPECLQQLVNTLDSNDIDRQEVRLLSIFDDRVRDACLLAQHAAPRYFANKSHLRSLSNTSRFHAIRLVADLGIIRQHSMH